MTPRILKEAMDEWSREARVPTDLADRALRGRRRGRLGIVTIAAVATAAVIVSVALVVPRLGPREPAATPTRHEVIHLAPAHRPPAKVTSGDDTDGSVLTDVENSPPQKMVAAGRLALSAYWTGTGRDTRNGPDMRGGTWYLLDPATRTYQKTPWAYLNVAPGLRYAAVLEKTLPASRIGVYDTETRRVLAWIPVERPVGGVVWSPDGTRLVATTYDGDPDLPEASTQCPPGRGDRVPGSGSRAPSANRIRTSRTGFYVIDVATATAGDFHAVDPCSAPSSRSRRDFAWSRDGSLLYELGGTGERPELFYDLNGRPHDPGVDYAGQSQAGVSPDGKLLVGEQGPPTSITELATGKVVARHRELPLSAWADDDHLIGRGCAGGCGDKFDDGLVLVSVDGRRAVQLWRHRWDPQSRMWWLTALTLR
jgi:hypothetical protein